MHKPQPAHRFIAALHACATTRLSRLCTSALTLILSTLKMKNREDLNSTDVRRISVVQGYEEIAQSFLIYRRTKATKQSLYTDDLTTIYTTIGHADLLLRIRE